jgi:putative Holliday junction resolvase
VRRFLGIDYGEKRIGLAVSDPTNTFAQPLTVLENKSQSFVFGEIQKLIEEKSITQVIAGLPKNMDGTLGEKAEEVLSFVKKLKEKIEIPVITWDERLSTVQAHKSLYESGMSLAKRKKKIDKIAAQFILQNYLDFVNSQEEKQEP